MSRFWPVMVAIGQCLALSGCGPAPVPAPPPSGTPRSLQTAQPGYPPEITELPYRKPRVTQMRSPAAGDWFGSPIVPTDVVYRDGNEQGFYTILESVGGGSALFDYDLDGDLDLFFPQGGTLSKPGVTVRGLPSKLLRNEGNDTFTDVTAIAGVGMADLYTHGCSVGDYDDDGFPDLFVTGYGGAHLYRNSQDGTFADVTAECGLSCPMWNAGSVWADFDRDGTLDLFVTTYLDWKPDPEEICRNDAQIQDDCGPNRYPGAPDQMWRGRGDGTFEDVSKRCGVAIPGRGFGAAAVELNADGWLDLYVVNDIQENFLFLGAADFQFTSAAHAWGVAASPTGNPQGSMGLDVGDFDGDGWPDLWYTNFTEEDNSLYRNVQGTSFVDATIRTQLAGKSWKWVGFGTVLEDFNHDGWLDIVIANGHVLYHSVKSPYFQPAQLFENQKGTQFREVTANGGPYFSVPHAGRGVASGDINDDGAVDLVISHQNDPAAVLPNQIPAKHWLRVQLVATKSAREAIGAHVVMQAGDRQLVRWVRRAGGYLSACDPRIVFPLTDDKPASVTVHWPSGAVETFSQLEQRTSHVLREGAGKTD